MMKLYISRLNCQAAPEYETCFYEAAATAAGSSSSSPVTFRTRQVNNNKAQVGGLLPGVEVTLTTTNTLNVYKGAVM